MRRTECAREADAFEAASLGWWPDRADEDLRAHVRACPNCAEVVAVTCALQDDRHEAVRTAPVLRADLVWRRAQRLALDEAARAAARPIALVHLTAVACAAAAALGLAGVAFGWFHALAVGLTGGLATFIEGVAGDVPGFGSLTPLLQWSVPIAVGLAAWLVLAPVAVYLTVADD